MVLRNIGFRTTASPPLPAPRHSTHAPITANRYQVETPYRCCLSNRRYGSESVSGSAPHARCFHLSIRSGTSSRRPRVGTDNAPCFHARPVPGAGNALVPPGTHAGSECACFHVREGTPRTLPPRCAPPGPMEAHARMHASSCDCAHAVRFAAHGTATNFCMHGCRPQHARTLPSVFSI